MPKKPNEKVKRPINLLRGMKDIMPEEQRYWNFVRQQIDDIARVYSFERIDTPLLEETALFSRSIGKDTDIIEKEMYSFIDKANNSISLRPEGTASIIRAYLEHGMLNRPQPVKLYYLGPFFRYDRPQLGRFRQFFQFGFEVVGDSHPVVDAQLVMMSYHFYTKIGMPVSMQVNSVGCPKCREDYKKVLVDYFRPRRNTLCEDCRRRLVKNPLRLLDCKEKDCQLIIQEAPQIVDYLDEECRLHFVKVLEHLDVLEIPYVLNTRLVRGLDYYSGTVFEVWPVEEQSTALDPNTATPASEVTATLETPAGELPAEERTPAQSALGGGGRYDYLVEMLGGQHTAAVGFAGGIERLILEIKNRDLSIGTPQRPDVFVAQLGDTARKKALRLFEELRQHGLSVTESFSKDGLKAQMELANKRQVKFTIILGQKEIMDGTILIRDMENGIQETIDYRRIIPELQKRLQKFGVVEKVENHNHVAPSANGKPA